MIDTVVDISSIRVGPVTGADDNGIDSFSIQTHSDHVWAVKDTPVARDAAAIERGQLVNLPGILAGGGQHITRQINTPQIAACIAKVDSVRHPSPLLSSTATPAGTECRSSGSDKLVVLLFAGVTLQTRGTGLGIHNIETSALLIGEFPQPDASLPVS